MPIQTQRVLLINCDRAIAEMMELCLETIPNCKVIIVDSSIEAVEKASTEKIDAMLLDVDEKVSVPSWSEIIRGLKQNPLTSSIPLILLSSTPQSQDLVELQRVTGVGAISLSFDLSNLATQISTLLNWN